MHVNRVDPRDRRWVTQPTTYRVYFWKSLGAEEPSSPDVSLPWASYEYELTDVQDVAEALDWAHANAEGRIFTFYAVHDREPERGLIQLHGTDPTIVP